MEEFLVGFELHVADKTFYLKGIVNAHDEVDAFSKIRNVELEGRTYHLQPKSVFGPLNKALEEYKHLFHELGGGIYLP